MDGGRDRRTDGWWEGGREGGKTLVRDGKINEGEAVVMHMQEKQI